jgi:hypothetical protein
VDGFGLAFRIAAALMVLTAVLTVLLFGDQGRGQKVDHAEITQRQRQQ